MKDSQEDMPIGKIGDQYVEACHRLNPHGQKSHLYADCGVMGLLPMCPMGWNTDDGQSYTILRGWRSKKGLCLKCLQNKNMGRLPFAEPIPHKTKRY